MSKRFQLLLLVISAGCPTPLGSQLPPQNVQRPSLPLPFRSYAAPAIPPIRLTNSMRLYSLIRAGVLYLSVRDALAIAIENNLNLETDRYGPLEAASALERAKAGGPLRGVPSASQQAATVVAGLGASGSQLAAGLLSSGGGGGSGPSGGAGIQQVGQVTPNLDPVLQNSSTFSHLTAPQANLFLFQTPVAIKSVRNYGTTLTEGFLSGGSLQYYDYQQNLAENVPSDRLNPAVGGYMYLYFRHPLLQGFGTQLNDRIIRMAGINTTASRERFRSQLLDLCAGVLNLYWDLVSARNEVQVRQKALEITQKFYDDTKFEISVGAIGRFELTRAEAEVATRRQSVVISQQAVEQRAIALKQALTHSEDPALEAAQILPLDGIEVPETDDLAPLNQLVSGAMKKRPDVAVSRFRDQTDEISLAGTTNPLLPTLNVYGYTLQRGVAGTPQPSGGPADRYFYGGSGNVLGQIFRRNFPSNVAGAYVQLPLGNRQAQGDYGFDQLQFRQSQLRGQRDDKQIAVDVANQLNALRQAHARYTVAQNTRILQERLLEADRKRASGSDSFNTLMSDQRSLITAQLSETTALASYARARVSLDQVLGETLERYDVSLDEGLAGRVGRESRLPDVLPNTAGSK